MKKLLTTFLSFLTIICLFASCNNIPAAEDFNSEYIDNGYYNYNSGGKMAYLNGEIYAVTSDAALNKELWAITKNGCEKICDMDSGIRGLYQFNDVVYGVFSQEKYLRLLDADKKEFEDSGIDIDRSAYFYIDDKLLIERDSSIKINKNNRQTGLDSSFKLFTVVNDNLYLFRDDGELFVLKTDAENKKPEHIGSFNYPVREEIFCIANDSIYFPALTDLGGDLSEGLYKFSIKTGELELLSHDYVKCVNTYDNIVYFSSNDGIYYVTEDNEPQKICGETCDEIYLFDDTWLYLYKDGGEILRVKRNPDEDDFGYVEGVCRKDTNNMLSVY